jgi:hypothetical protein
VRKIFVDIFTVILATPAFDKHSSAAAALPEWW